MSQTTPLPSLPLDGGAGYSSFARALGQLAAAAFVAVVVLMSARIMAFTPAPDAECLPEICGPAQNR